MCLCPVNVLSRIYNKHLQHWLSYHALHVNSTWIIMASILEISVLLLLYLMWIKGTLKIIDIQSRRPWINEKVLYLSSVHCSTPSLFPSFILQYVMVFTLKNLSVAPTQPKIWPMEFMIFSFLPSMLEEEKLMSSKKNAFKGSFFSPAAVYWISGSAIWTVNTGIKNA